MSKFAAQAATAVRMIKSKGAITSFSRVMPGTFDPVTQASVGETTKTLKMPVVGLAPGKSAEFKIGTLEKRKIIELHCAPNLADAPAEGDKVTWKGHDWTVIWVDELDPDGGGAVYAKAYAER